VETKTGEHDWLSEMGEIPHDWIFSWKCGVGIQRPRDRNQKAYTCPYTNSEFHTTSLLSGLNFLANCDKFQRFCEGGPEAPATKYLIHGKQVSADLLDSSGDSVAVQDLSSI
jgi:hypothetical protein